MKDYNALKGGSPPLDPNAPKRDDLGIRKVTQFIGVCLLVLVGVIFIRRIK